MITQTTPFLTTSMNRGTMLLETQETTTIMVVVEWVEEI